jgi:hypothetical protein
LAPRATDVAPELQKQLILDLLEATERRGNTEGPWMPS